MDNYFNTLPDTFEKLVGSSDVNDNVTRQPIMDRAKGFGQFPWNAPSIFYRGL